MSELLAIDNDSLWGNIYPPPRREVIAGGPPPEPNGLADAVILTMWVFYVAFQTLVLILAIAVLAGLIVAIIMLTNGSTAAGLVTGIGSVATGAGSVFLQTQASKALARYKQAEKSRRLYLAS